MHQRLFAALILFVLGALAAPPTNSSLLSNFLFSGNATSQMGLVTYDITNNTGTMLIRGQIYDTVAYYTQLMGDPNPPGKVRWINLFGVSQDNNNIAIVYIGCNPPPDTDIVTDVWEEDFYNPLTSDNPKSGTPCDFVDRSDDPALINVTLPGVSGSPNPYNTGITILGDQVGLNDNIGWFVASETNYSLTTITTVDCEHCGRNCHTCDLSPWFELHFIYSTPMDAEMGFGIFYIYPRNHSFVQLNYTLTVPTLSQYSITYDAQWSGSLINNRRGSFLDRLVGVDI
eukprot:TRINITY_DN3401_c0_g1_i1.p1 TRINITY_DN3401_c0_g1~~TRINITY_DN3401_c0_g1_i1.p1  ORF type:complete len:295 (-),score=38.07 TRINITY_DN3401_c0_g1_i1:42-899(-)